jgi:hypothetical protein
MPSGNCRPVPLLNIIEKECHWRVASVGWLLTLSEKITA